MDIKQAIVVRTDLKMGKGKIAGQVAHASLKCYEYNEPHLNECWNNTGYTKIILKAPSKQTIFKLKYEADKRNITNFIVHDLGHTQVPNGEPTCIGLGADINERINELTKGLKLL